MNKNNAKDFLPFVKALSEGKTIQLNQRPSLPGGQWMDMHENIDIVFSGSPEEWRVKPDPFETTLWVRDKDRDFVPTTDAYTSEVMARKGYRLVRMREIV